MRNRVLFLCCVLPVTAVAFVAPRSAAFAPMQGVNHPVGTSAPDKGGKVMGICMMTQGATPSSPHSKILAIGTDPQALHPHRPRLSLGPRA
jgi:hypothetical protein